MRLSHRAQRFDSLLCGRPAAASATELTLPENRENGFDFLTSTMLGILGTKRDRSDQTAEPAFITETGKEHSEFFALNSSS